MKKSLPVSLVTLGLSAISLPAANIAWVSFHPADGTPSGAAATAGFTNAPDIGYTTALTANGHNVTRFVTVDNLDTALLPDGVTPVLAALQTNDLIILSRSTPSGHYQALGEVTAWSGITNPVMVLGGFTTRGGTGGGSRLGLTTGETIADINVDPVRLRANAPGHPIFAGIALDGNRLMVNPYARRVAFTNANTGAATLQTGISVNNNPPAIGGSILAVVGTTGSAGFNGMVVGEIPSGVTVANAAGSYVLGGKRMIFLTGTRESGITSEGAGIYDLLTDGTALLLNAVTYLLTPQTPAPKIYAPLIGATNLLEGDAWTFDNPAVNGESPLSYQWYKNGQPIPTGTDPALAFANLVSGDAGEYQLIVTNVHGSATSTVARLDFAVLPPASITNSLIAYWPLDGVLGSKTVDLVSGYDMALINMGGADVVAGKWGNAFQFNGTNSLLERIHNPGDALPIYNHPNFTLSLWVNGLPQADKRVYAEGLTTSVTPIFDLGTHNGAADGTVDIFIRSDANVASPNHAHSIATGFDGIWRNVVYVQRDVGNGNIRARLWVDGVLDPVAFTPTRPLTLNTTAIGALRRASASAWFAGMIDEVAVWNRALSTEEIGILQVTAITNPPSRLQPLVINSFKADLPAVVSGGSTVLRWDVSKDATLVTISPLGDVTAQTIVGIGSRSITQSLSAAYVLTVNRGVDSLSATTSVAVVEGVAAGWKILDNFDQAQLGNLFASGYWNDTSGNGGQVVSVNGNRALRTSSAGISFLNLRGLSIQETQTCTLFFRVIAGEDNAANVLEIAGLTDKSQRNFGDADDNIGPVLYASPFTNDAVGITTNGWYLGARNSPGGAIDYFGNQPQPQSALEAAAVYNVWVDITNAPLSDSANDIFSVYVQKEGGAPRAVLFQDYISDRDLFLVDPVLGGIGPLLDKLVVMGNSATFSAVFDDFYLNVPGYNATVPKPYAIGQPPGPLSVTWVGNQLQISWSNGTLQSSANVNGPYVDVPGNPASPHLVAPAGERTFYRSRQ
jgi:hypothetical protein